MKQIIKRVTYNTDTSDFIGGHNIGKYGDCLLYTSIGETWYTITF